MVAAPAITLGLEEGGYLTGSVAREVLLGVVPGSMSAPGLAGGWDLPLGLLSSPRDKLQGTVSVNLSATGDSTDQEIAKWNVTASFWWTHMPIYGPEMLLRILRAAEHVRGYSILETSVVSTRESMARVTTVIQVSVRHWCFLRCWPFAL